MGSALRDVFHGLQAMSRALDSDLTCPAMWADACEVDREACLYEHGSWEDRVKLSERLVGVALRGPDCATLPRVRCAERGD